MSLKNSIEDLIPDKLFLKMKYKKRTGKRLNLENPVTYNEKIQWLKLYDRREEYVEMVDKYLAKPYVESIIGSEYIIPTIGVWDTFDEIDFDQLPNQFVLKCTHDSGGLVIVQDKSKLDITKARNKINKSLKTDYYKRGREWPYKNVKRRIIAEPYLVDESGTELKDYKIFNFGGVPKLIQVDFGRFKDHKRNLYTPEWEMIDAKIEYPNDRNHIIQKPQELERMLKLASKLSAGYPHIRTDFYYINGEILFGELTLYHGSGFENFYPESFCTKMGEWLKLDTCKKIKKHR